jgi:predicted DsbA family dithiol-disulfide isomerase
MLIDVYSDIACPWCWIGERRLRAALDRRPDLAPTLRWRPFQLRPDLPTPSRPWSEFVDEKFGGLVRAQPMFEQLTRLGAEVAVPFAFERMVAAPNTALAHQLILLAGEHGKAWPAAEALFRAHFHEGRDVGDVAVLRAVAGSLSLPAAESERFDRTPELAQEVEDSQREAARLGITGVPFYVLDGRLGVSGAQAPEVFLQAFDQLAAVGAEEAPE